MYILFQIHSSLFILVSTSNKNVSLSVYRTSLFPFTWIICYLNTSRTIHSDHSAIVLNNVSRLEKSY